MKAFTISALTKLPLKASKTLTGIIFAAGATSAIKPAMCVPCPYGILLAAYFARVVVHINKVEARQQVAGKRGMSGINASIENGDLDWLSILEAPVNLLRRSQMNRLGRPLCDIRAGVAANARVANTPGVAAAFWRLIVEIRLRENNSLIQQQRIYFVSNVSGPICSANFRDTTRACA